MCTRTLCVIAVLCMYIELIQQNILDNEYAIVEAGENRNAAREPGIKSRRNMLEIISDNNVSENKQKNKHKNKTERKWRCAKNQQGKKENDNIQQNSE